MLRYYPKVDNRNSRLFGEKKLEHGFELSDSFDNVLGLDRPPGYGFNKNKYDRFMNQLGIFLNSFKLMASENN